VSTASTIKEGSPRRCSILVENRDAGHAAARRMDHPPRCRPGQRRPGSAILLGELAATSPRVVPIYVRFGMFWDDREEEAIRRYVTALRSDGNLRLVRPYAHLATTAVLLRGGLFPLGLTWSCMRPVDSLQCGQCNKCAERRRAFAAAGITDPTVYAQAAPRREVP
jgi:hypothetical protein